MKNRWSLILCAVLVLGFGPLAAVCASGTSEASANAAMNAGNKSTASFVTLKMILLGDAPPDASQVYDTLNTHLKQDINANVDVQFLPWADWRKKYDLILASGQDYDLIAANNWSGFVKDARDGAFHAITMQELETYAPRTFKDTPQEVFNSGMVDGKLYNLAENYKEISVYGYVVRGDILKQTGMQQISSLDDFGKYLDFVKNNNPDMIPWDNGVNDQGDLFRSLILFGQGYANIDPLQNAPSLAAKVENNPKVVDWLDVPGVADYLKRMKRWKDSGYWSRNALVNKTLPQDSFKSGKSAAFISNLLNASSVYSAINKEHPDWNVQFFPVSNHPLPSPTYLNNGMAISEKSRNIGRALMFLDLLRNDQWYNQLTTYGIKGTHWDLSSDGKLISLKESSNYPPDGACPWGWRNSKYYLVPQGAIPGYESILKQFQATTISSNISDFTIDKSQGKISSIEAALVSIGDQYFNPLLLGYSSDVDKDLAALRKQLQDAGLQDLENAVQKQLDSYGVTVNM